jgi:hypothetical protein
LRDHHIGVIVDVHPVILGKMILAGNSFGAGLANLPEPDPTTAARIEIPRRECAPALGAGYRLMRHQKVSGS